jgi:hypothetical protein
MDDRAGAPRRLRGLVTAGLCTLLIAVGAALRRVLARGAHPVGPAADAVLPPLRAAGPSLLPWRVALAAVPGRRGPPAGC